MKNIILMAILIPFIAACSGSNKGDREAAQNNHKTALEDSIKTAQQTIDSCSVRIQELSSAIDTNISEFAYVEKAREVEGYYILRNWQAKYPLQSTGIIARMNKGEELELIAVLKGGTFDQIEVSSGENSARSSVVPHDQALNYRRDGLTTVMFSGAESDEVGKFIADNELNNIKLTFLEGGKIKGTWNIPAEYKKMVAQTWVVASSSKEMHSLELKSSMLHKKIDIIRRHLE